MLMTNSLQRSRLILSLLLALLAPAVAQAQAGSGHRHDHPPPGGAVADDPQAQAGLSIPDVAVLDQEGRELRFYRDLVADKVVAMNFIFTTCTTICPPMGANFGKLQRLLGERMGRDLHLISVSVDPVTDTPQRLEAWAGKFGSGPGWTLVTGQKTEVDRLLKALQVFTPDFNDHSPVVLVGSPTTGRWTRAYGLAPAPRLAALLEQAARDAAPEGGGR